MAISTSTPASMAINNPGGVTAPSGQSAAARMVKERRERGRRYTLRTRKQAAARRGGANKPAPYNALDSPFKTQAQFNQAVARNAKSMYQPELDTIKTEEGNEAATTAQHQGANVQIYNQLSQQAENALAQGRSAMAEIASRQNASTQQGQQALQAALSNTGVSGLQGVANPQQFTAAAAGLGNAGSQVLAGLQTGLTGELTKNLSVPGAGLQQATGEEQLRNQGVVRKLGSERQQVNRRIPDFLSKARTELSKQEQERQANKLQAQIAKGKLGLEKTTQAQNFALGKGQLAQKREEAKQQAALKIRELSQQAGFNAEQLQVEREKIAAAAGETNDAKKKAAAELAGKRWDNGLTIMSEYLKPTATEFIPSGTAADKTKEQEGKTPIRKSAMDLYRMLTGQAKMTAPEAFGMMKASNNGYVRQFAEEHLRDFEGRQKNTGRGVKGASGPPKKKK